MLAILLIWLYIFLICLIFGWALVRSLNVLLQEEHSPGLPLSLVVLLGLAVLTGLTGYLSLLTRIGALAHGLVFLGALLLLGVFPKEIFSLFKLAGTRLWSLPKAVLVLLVLGSLFILLKAAGPPTAFDTGLYHAQAIRWIEEYPVIPGLGNLHGRLAFNSAWFLANALFGFSFLRLGPFHVLNGFLTLLLMCMSLRGLSNLLQGAYRFSSILRAGMLLPVLFVFKEQLSSPTPDIPVAWLTAAVFIYYLELTEKPKPVSPRLVALAVVLLAALTITIKMSALPLALFMVVLTARELARGRPRNWWLSGGAVLFLALPFFLRNIWLSGYLLYPLPGLDLFNFDWKIPAAAALKDQRVILEFARDPGYLAPPGVVKSALAWVPYWLPQMLKDYGSKLEKILLPALLLLGDWLAHLLKWRSLRIDLGAISAHLTLYLTAAAGLLFWFATAPDPRFAVGFLMITAIIIFIPFFKPYAYQVTRFFPWSVGLLTLYFLAVFAVPDLPALPQRLWRPAPYPRASLTVQKMQGHQVYVTRHGDDKCWYAPLPCSRFPLTFTWRGEGLAQGLKPRQKPNF